MGSFRQWFSSHCLQEKVVHLKVLGKSCFMQNLALKLHQPNMHIGYRVIPLSVHQKSLARIIWILTHYVATILLLQVTQLMSEIFR